MPAQTKDLQSTTTSRNRFDDGLYWLLNFGRTYILTVHDGAYAKVDVFVVDIASTNHMYYTNSGGEKHLSAMYQPISRPSEQSALLLLCVYSLLANLFLVFL